MYVCIFVYTHVCGVCECVCVVYVCVGVYGAYTHTHTHVYIYMHMCVCVCTHTYTHPPSQVDPRKGNQARVMERHVLCPLTSPIQEAKLLG